MSLILIPAVLQVDKNMGMNPTRKAVMGIGTALLPRHSPRDVCQVVLLVLLAVANCASTTSYAAEVLSSATTMEGTATVATPPDARGSGAATIKAPMPPTNLTVVDVPPATELVDRVFKRSGVAIETRARLVTAMKDLSSGDLTYLAKGSDPSHIGLYPPEPAITEDWQSLVHAYAEAAIVDRKQRSEFVSQLTIGGLLAVFSFIGGMLLERLKTRIAVLSTALAKPQQTPKNHEKRRRQRKGR
jgi:hypothetical protein